MGKGFQGMTCALIILVVAILLVFQATAQKQCSSDPLDIFVNQNKFPPQFDQTVYVVSAICVDKKSADGLLFFKVVDADLATFFATAKDVRISSNDSNFFVTYDTASSQFKLNLNGTLFYNNNNLHQYAVYLTATDNGRPERRGTALVLVPLLNFNMNAPSYNAPYSIAAAINFKTNTEVTILNAWDLDGDAVSFKLDPNQNSNAVLQALDLSANGVLRLKQDLSQFSSSFTFYVILTDDGSSCQCQSVCITRTTAMTVNFDIIELNLYTPTFIANANGDNFCEKKFQVNEKTQFGISLLAEDNDRPGPNRQFWFSKATDSNTYFNFTASEQIGNRRAVVVQNTMLFDYENPITPSNIMSFALCATDLARSPRTSCCFLKIEILDVNDNAPKFTLDTYVITLIPNLKKFYVYAADKDSGLNGQVEYFVDPRDIKIAEYLQSRYMVQVYSDGTITLPLEPLKFNEPNGQLSFRIIARDKGQPSLQSDPATVILRRPSVNKANAPSFINSGNFVVNVSEKRLGEILKVALQSSANISSIRCRAINREDANWFSAEKAGSQQGQECSLKMNTADYRKFSSPVIYLIAEDPDSNDIQDVRLVTVNLNEENLYPPAFESGNSVWKTAIAEGSTSLDLGKVVAWILASDEDKTPENNAITYELLCDGAACDRFGSSLVIDPNSGKITLQQPVNDVNKLSFRLTAKNRKPIYGSNATAYGHCFLDVTVIDINANPPQFSQSGYSFVAPETVSVGEGLGRFDVTDRDFDSYFNFSTTNSKFGIRQVRDVANVMGSHRVTAELFLNTPFDFQRQRIYQFEVHVSDSLFVTVANVTVTVTRALYRPPIFTQAIYTATVLENQVPPQPILQLSASPADPAGSKDFVFELQQSPIFNVTALFSLQPNGQLLVNPPGLAYNYNAVYVLTVSVFAREDSSKSTNYAQVRISVTDTNNKAPYLVYDGNATGPLIIYEKDANGATFFNVADDDDPVLFPPSALTFQLLSSLELFSWSPQPCVSDCGLNRRRFKLSVKSALTRTQNKFYDLSYRVADGVNQRQGVFRLVVGGVDANPQSDATKKVLMLSYANNLPANSFLGTLFVNDLDDWDLVQKTPSQCTQPSPQLFTLGPGLQIFGPPSGSTFPVESMTLQCTVNDPLFPSAKANVNFVSQNINYEDTIDLAVLRVLGVNAEDFMSKQTPEGQSAFDRFSALLVQSLGLGPSDRLTVVTVKNYIQSTNFPPNRIPDISPSSYGTELLIFARRNSLLVSSREIYSLISAARLSSFENKAVVLVVDACRVQSDVGPGFCGQNTFCNQNLVTLSIANTVDANATALVGLNNIMNAECLAAPPVPAMACLNQGQKQLSAGGSDFYCDCSTLTFPDLRGPLCQFTNIMFSFSPSVPSYALFPTEQLQDPFRIEFEFSTENSRGLLFYFGPLGRTSSYFVAVELNNASLVARVGQTRVPALGSNLADRNWHKVDLIMSLDFVQVILDKCQTQTALIENYTRLMSDRMRNDPVAISLGGVPEAITNNHYYFAMLGVFEYEGCIRNLKVNGVLKDLTLQPGASSRAMNADCACKHFVGCQVGPFEYIKNPREFPWWVILIILAALLMLATVMALALCTVRRKDNIKKMLQMFPDDDIRETIINYADGAGEENTENFNIGVIKKPLASQKVTKIPVVNSLELHSNDQNMIFGYEGEGSDAGSLSEIGSQSGEAELDFRYLSEWGPKFFKLSKIYHYEVVEDTDYQNLAFEDNFEKHSQAKAFNSKPKQQ